MLLSTKLSEEQVEEMIKLFDSFQEGQFAYGAVVQKIMPHLNLESDRKGKKKGDGEGGGKKKKKKKG